MSAIKPLSDDEIESICKSCGGFWNGSCWEIEDADLHPFVRTLLAASRAEVEMLREANDALLDIPRGWEFNEARPCEDTEGAWNIGFLSEEETFSPIITVDTGLYYQPDQAEPLARAILGRLSQQQPAPLPVEAGTQVRVPLTDEQILQISERSLDKCHCSDSRAFYVVREVERAHGVLPAVGLQPSAGERE